MRIFSTAARHGRHTVYVCPAAKMKAECPADWVDGDNKPVTFPVHFLDGEANVPNDLGKWMKVNGYAASIRIPERAFQTMTPQSPLPTAVPFGL